MIKIIAETRAQMDEFISGLVQKTKEFYPTYWELGNELGICSRYANYVGKGARIPYNNLWLIKQLFKMAGKNTNNYGVWVVDENGRNHAVVQLFPTIANHDVKRDLMKVWRILYKKHCVTKSTKDWVFKKTGLSWNGFKNIITGKMEPRQSTINRLFRAMGFHLVVFEKM